MSTPSPDLIACIEGLTSWIEEIHPPNLGDDSYGEHELARWFGIREKYAERIEQVGAMAANTQWMVLQDLGLILQSHIHELIAQQTRPSEQEYALLREWPALLIAYVNLPQDPQAGEDLISYLQNPHWVTPLPEDYIEALRPLLTPEPDYSDIPGEQQAWDEQQMVSSADGQGEQSHAADSQAMQNEAEIVPQDDSGQDDSGTLTLQSNDSGQNDLESAGALNPEQQELVDLLRAELAEIIEAQDEVLSVLCTDGDQQESWLSVLSTYADQIERIGSAAAIVGLTGLLQVSDQIHANLQALGTQSVEPFGQERLFLLKNWPVRLLGYLQNIRDPRACGDLVTFLQDAAWPNPLPPQEAESFFKLLGGATIITKDETAVSRQTQAHPEDVSLQIPDDVDKAVLDGLLQELPNQTMEFSGAIQRVLNGGFISDLDVAQRIAHTLKGAGNVAGVRGIAVLTHNLEDILQALSKGNVLPPPGLGETLMSAADCLEGMSEALLGMGDPPADAVEVLQEVLDWIERIDREGIPSNEGKPESDHPSNESIELNSVQDGDIPIDSEQGVVGTKGTENLAPEAMLRIPAIQADELLRLAGENLILNSQLQEQVMRSIDHAKSLRQQNTFLQQLSIELEHLVDIRGLWSLNDERTSEEEFDSLELNQYNELHTFTHRLMEAVTDTAELTQTLMAQLSALYAMSVDQGRMNMENQESVMKIRMVPVTSVVPRLKRSLRQACRMTGKNAELHITGADTLIDSNVLNDLTDPLMHLLRNAVDHGLESSGQRSAVGKSSVGRIDLEFARKGDHILVRCRDDGAGLDYEVIRQKAEQRGLISSEAAPSEDDLNRMILTPGFSTRENVSQVSGRGVGMDAVHALVRELKGTLSIHSETGQGMVIELVIPVTLLSTHAILVRLGQRTVAIANRGVEELYYSGAGELLDMGSKLVYQLGDEVYEAVHLDRKVDLLADSAQKSQQAYSVLLVRKDNGSKTAVLVQEVLDTRDIVVKPLSQFALKKKGVVGATIVGDGSVAPVLDLTELLTASRWNPVDVGDAHSAESGTERLPSALVVDDSLSARRSLAQFVKDIGYEVRTAKDGMEAVSSIEERSPDILLVDLEMPRMNGLELTSHVRSQQAFRDIPVIMITSRSTDKHRRQAEKAGVNIYMTKPFSEDELVNNITSCLGRA